MQASPVATLLEAKENELASKLAQTRAALAHAGDRGDASEAAFRQFLTLHLARHYDVGEGEVVDTAGARSRQMDVVMTTADHPLRQAPGEPGLFIVEGIYALGEVKTSLSTGELDDVVEKGRSVKALSKSHLRGSEVFANPADIRRWVEGPPPFFAFAYEMSVAVQTLIDRLAAAGEPPAVDAVFVLGRGQAINFGDGSGVMRLAVEDRGLTGWAWLQGQPVLLSLLGWLHSLPRVAHRQSPFLNYLGQTPGEGAVEVFVPSATP
jgi:hypothetical protein